MNVEALPRRRLATAVGTLFAAAPSLPAALAARTSNGRARTRPRRKPCRSMVATVVASEVATWDEFSGRLEAVERVDVRSRVAGAVQSVALPRGRAGEGGRPAGHDRPGALRGGGRPRPGPGRRRAGAPRLRHGASTSARSACGRKAPSPSASSTSA